MKVSLEGIKESKDQYAQAGVKLPLYDVKEVTATTVANPTWFHMGSGNIFRGFIGSLQQELLNQGIEKTGICTLTIFKGEEIELICNPHDNLITNVTLLPDTSVEIELLGSVVANYRCNGEYDEEMEAVVKAFRNPSLQMFSYTITEKGYALKDMAGEYLPAVKADFENGPAAVLRNGMALTCALLFERFKAGRLPLAVVSMDNCSHNGENLKQAVLTVADEWLKRGFVDQDFIDYLNDDKTISFPWSMIDKITPRPDPRIAKLLNEKGLEDMEPIKTSSGTFIAPFVNAEKPQYLVIEDNFPNGRPALDKVGVLFTTREKVDLCERMKVTTCLNPLHTALAVYGCVLGYDLIAKEMDDKDLVALVSRLGYKEGLPVVDDPEILSPKAFIDEVIEQRLTNRSLPDTPQRIATDTSLKVPVRFGQTLKNYQKRGMDASSLKALPLAIAGWLRYLLAVDDNGNKFEPSADPQMAYLQGLMAGIEFGKPETVGDKLKPILENANLFGVNLYDVGLGKVVETMFAEEIAGVGAVRATLQKYLAD